MLFDTSAARASARSISAVWTLCRGAPRRCRDNYSLLLAAAAVPFTGDVSELVRGGGAGGCAHRCVAGTVWEFPVHGPERGGGGMCPGAVAPAAPDGTAAICTAAGHQLVAGARTLADELLAPAFLLGFAGGAQLPPPPLFLPPPLTPNLRRPGCFRASPCFSRWYHFAVRNFSCGS